MLSISLVTIHLAGEEKIRLLLLLKRSRSLAAIFYHDSPTAVVKEVKVTVSHLLS